MAKFHDKAIEIMLMEKLKKNKIDGKFEEVKLKK